MSNLTVIDNNAEAAKVEAAFIQGDLSVLSEDERLQYYLRVCHSLEINPATRPLEFIKLNGKLVLYARKDCTDQLRSNRGVSGVGKPDIQVQDGLCIVSVMLQDRHGRTDSDIGITVLGQLQGEAKANAIMKAVTKAKRRATLSLCGLGILDESELDTITDYKPMEADLQTGEIVTIAAAPPAQEPAKSAKDLMRDFKMKAGEYQFSSSDSAHYEMLHTLLLKGKAKVTAETLSQCLACSDDFWRTCIDQLLQDIADMTPAQSLMNVPQVDRTAETMRQ